MEIGSDAMRTFSLSLESLVGSGYLIMRDSRDLE